MAPKTKAPASPGQITIPGVQRKNVELWLIGDSPLIVHAWDPQSRADMLGKQMGKPTGPRRAKDPSADCNACFYVHENAYVFPAIPVKRAAVSASRFVEAKMTEARGMFFVLSDWLPIHGTQPVPREDMVRLGGTTADLRYRPMFERWALPITVEFNSAFVQPAQIVNLFENAGFGVGLGEWRPEKNGPFGRFHVARGDEHKEFVKMIPKVRPIVVDTGDVVETGARGLS